MTEAVVTNKLDYSALNPSDQVRSILGAVQEPVLKQQVIDFSGIDYKGLDEQGRAAVDAVFAEGDVEVKEVEGQMFYRLGDKARETLSASVNMQSVHSRIAEKLMEDMGFSK